MGGNKIVVFSIRGQPIKVIPLRNILIVEEFNCYKSQKLLVSSEFMGTESDIFWVNKKKNILKYSIPKAIEIHPSQGPMNTQHVTLPFQPKTQWDLIGKNRLVVWDGSGNKIFKMTLQKDTLGFILVSSIQIPVSKENIKEWINSTYSSGQTLFGHQNFFKGVREALFEYVGYAEYFPLIMDIKEGAGESLWLLRGTVNDRQIWTLYRKAKKPLTVKFPKGRIVYQFGKGWIIMANKTEKGRVNVEVYNYDTIVD